MKEFKIGEKIQLGRIKLRVEEAKDDSCNGCFFKKEPDNVCAIMGDILGACTADFREDK